MDQVWKSTQKISYFITYIISSHNKFREKFIIDIKVQKNQTEIKMIINSRNKFNGWAGFDGKGGYHGRGGHGGNQILLP